MTDLPSGLMKTLPLHEFKLPTAVLGFELHPGGERGFAACHDGIYELDIKDGKAQKLYAHESYASGVVCLPDGNTLVSSGYDGALRWLDLRTRQVMRTVAAHRFWSWQLARSNDGTKVASVTGQYLCGGTQYEPGPQQEPSVRVYDTKDGACLFSFDHTPPVLSVAFSPEGRFIAAGNMMGEVRVWDLLDGQQVSTWNTPSFTSWGVIKSHHYIGGIFSLVFAPDSNSILAAGMGPMNDPMAGNGKQTWQRFLWRETPVKKSAEIQETDQGNGLMESLALHPSKPWFVMAGRMAQGKWNTAIFSLENGSLLHSLDSKIRVTRASFDKAGGHLILAGASGQERKKDGAYPEYGRVKVYRVAEA